jgi:hypothetical protein
MGWVKNATVTLYECIRNGTILKYTEMVMHAIYKIALNIPKNVEEEDPQNFHFNEGGIDSVLPRVQKSAKKYRESS